MELLTVREVAAALKVTEQTVRMWCQNGKLKAKRLHPYARAWRIERTQLEAIFTEDAPSTDETRGTL